MPQKEPISRHHVAGGENRFDPGVFENAPAALQHDRVIVDDENGCHDAVLA
jgi:hypothetical protein